MRSASQDLWVDAETAWAELGALFGGLQLAFKGISTIYRREAMFSEGRWGEAQGSRAQKCDR
jgi:hypothetical protein